MPKELEKLRRTIRWSVVSCILYAGLSCWLVTTLGCRALADDQKAETTVNQKADPKAEGLGSVAKSEQNPVTNTSTVYGSNAALIIAVIVLGLTMLGGMAGQTALIAYLVWNFRYQREKYRWIESQTKALGGS